jgi:hypothetical protein
VAIVSEGRSATSWAPGSTQRVLSIFLKAIPNPVQGLDHIEIAIGTLESFAEPFDVAVDGAIINVDLVVVGWSKAAML